MAEEKATPKKPAKKAEDKKAEPKQAAIETYEVTVPLLNIREKATLDSRIVGTLEKEEKVQVSNCAPQGFGKLAGQDGYILLEYASKVAGE